MFGFEQQVVNGAENFDLGEHFQQDTVAVGVDLHQNSRIRLRKQTLVGSAPVPCGISKKNSASEDPLVHLRFGNSIMMEQPAFAG
jgi:hypothetical protein